MPGLITLTWSFRMLTSPRSSRALLSQGGSPQELPGPAGSRGQQSADGATTRSHNQRQPTFQGTQAQPGQVLPAVLLVLNRRFSLVKKNMCSQLYHSDKHEVLDEQDEMKPREGTPGGCYFGEELLCCSYSPSPFVSLETKEA